MIRVKTAELRTLTVQITLRALDEISVGEYKGSAFRGALGHALNQISCFSKQTCLERCAHPGTCPYGYLFETPRPEGTLKMRKYTTVPHPFVLTPPLEEKMIYFPGDLLAFELCLIGKGTEYLPYFIYAFEKQGMCGLGKGRGRFEMVQVAASPRLGDVRVLYEGSEQTLVKGEVEGAVTLHDFSPLPAPVEKAAIRFLTPLRMKFEEELAVVPEFHILARNLLRRLSSLLYFHEGVEVNWDFKELIEKAKGVRLAQNSTRWYDWERYSNRQQARMSLGGILGEAMYEGDIAPIWPFLKAGEVVHAGKNTSFGLGKYEILYAGGIT